MIGNLDNDAIEEVLTAEKIGRIGCYAFDRVYVVPITYAYDGEYVYCHTCEGQKIGMMRANPKICFQVDTVKSSSNWRSVIAQGEYEELTCDEDLVRATQNLYKTNTIYPGIIFRIKLLDKTGKKKG